MMNNEYWYVHDDREYSGSYVVTNTEEWKNGDEIVAYTETCDGNDERNARLIAAAPQMLETLKIISRKAEKLPDGIGYLIMGWADDAIERFDTC